MSIVRKYFNLEALKELITKLPKETHVKYFSDSKWVYPLDLPSQLRNAKDSPMLDVMIEIEQKPGIVIYIPLVTDEDLHKPVVEPKVEHDPIDDIEEVKDVDELLVPKDKKVRKPRGKKVGK